MVNSFNNVLFRHRWHNNFTACGKQTQMTQREVQAHDNTTWVCVQALSGVSAGQDQIENKIQDDHGNVPVVCTPSGGAQTVRIQLPKDWLDATSDENLLAEIRKQRS
jgi:hypothetical protein